MIQVQLKPEIEKNVIRKISYYGFPWVFHSQCLLPQGQSYTGLAELLSSKGEFLAFGAVNSRSWISFRILSLSRIKSEVPLRNLLASRLKQAYELRCLSFGPADCENQETYRWVHGESDGIPGLIIDLYRHENSSIVAVVQVHALYLIEFLDLICDEILKLLPIKGLIVKYDSGHLSKEGLSTAQEVPPQQYRSYGLKQEDLTDCYAYESGLKISVDLWSGQKTGYFYDHRINRRFLSQLQTSQMVDLFSYVGSWGFCSYMAMRSRGLSQTKRPKVAFVDVSSQALLQIEKTIVKNRLPREDFILMESDLLKGSSDLWAHLSQEMQWKTPSVLQEWKTRGVVACDPPSMSSGKDQKEKTLKAHERCFQAGLDLSPKILSMSACSFHFSQDELHEICFHALRKSQRPAQLIYQGSMSPDHPVLWQLPETHYLKSSVWSLGENLI